MSCYAQILILSVFLILSSLHRIEKSIALVEYQPVSIENISSKNIPVKNAEKYVKILEELSKDDNILIIIFPEATLEAGRGKNDLKWVATGPLQKSDVPCKPHVRNYSLFLRELSCASRYYHTIMFLNLIQKIENQFYTTDVVFNFDGSLGYFTRREKRIDEDDLDHQPIPFEIPVHRNIEIKEDIGFGKTINTSFTVTSLVTGFLFSYTKMIDLAKPTNYMICSNWISQLPFLTSLQVHQMWAHEFNVTLFFSGANNPETGRGGTGIYHAVGGPILMDIVAEGGTRAYVYKFTDDQIPGTVFPETEEKDVDTLAKEMDNFNLRVDPDLIRYKSLLLDTGTDESNAYLCYDRYENHFCCSFSIKLFVNDSVQAKKQYTYHLVAYKGSKTYFSLFEPGGVEVCGVIACLGKNLSSCGKRFDKYEEIGWPITFEEITIKAEFAVPHKERFYYSSQFPNSLLSSIRPIHPKFTSWTKEIVFDGTRNVTYLERTFSLIEPQDRILTFAIFGRNFSLQDGEPPSNRESLFVLSPVVVFVNWYLIIVF